MKVVIDKVNNVIKFYGEKIAVKNIKKYYAKPFIYNMELGDATTCIYQFVFEK